LLYTTEHKGEEKCNQNLQTITRVCGLCYTTCFITVGNVLQFRIIGQFISLFAVSVVSRAQSLYMHIKLVLSEWGVR
jgi:hypothetical protein